jgi:hypothetical protein
MPLTLIACTWLSLAAGLSESPPLQFGQATPVAELNERCANTDGWIGADGAHSVALGPGKTLFLYSDTFVGKIKDGKRTGATMVNNSVGLLEGSGNEAKMRYFVKQDASGKPIAMITPADGKGWFWLQAGAYVDGKLYLFLPHIERSGAHGIWGFRCTGLSLGIVANPLDEPPQWKVEQLRIPFTHFDAEREINFGCAVCQAGEHLYIYGTDEKPKVLLRDRQLIVARAPIASIADAATWRFYQRGQWTTDFRSAEHLAGSMGSEASVSYLPAFKKYVLVYSENGLSTKILIRSADRPTGPWSPPTLVYDCPEPRADKRIMTYAAKGHANLSGGRDLVLTYATNSSDFWHAASDARVYWPRFLRVAVSQP